MAIPTKRFPRAEPVNYDDFRPQIRSGDLLLCSGSALFSRMIQRATRSVWSHVAFVMRVDSIDRVMVLESREPIGVRTVPLRTYLADYDDEVRGRPYPGGMVLARHRAFKEAAPSDTSLRSLGRFAADLLGYPYDKDEIAKIAARIVAGFLPFSKAEKRALKHDREYICSEYVYECYKTLGIEIAHDRRGFVAPADFARASEVDLVAVLKGKS